MKIYLTKKIKLQSLLKYTGYFGVLLYLPLLASCSESSNSNTLDQFTLTGTVPGTLIEAFGENGSYYRSISIKDESGQNSFSLALKAGVYYHLFMTVNEDDPTNKITTPISLNSDKVFTAKANEKIDLGYLSIYSTRDDAVGLDANNDGVLDSFHNVNVPASSIQVKSSNDTTDSDNDGIHNIYDSEYSKDVSDQDGDGLPDTVDINPHNNYDSSDDHNVFAIHLDRNNDGYLDEDRNRDGYYDDDNDRDGYHDDDNDRDGYHDDDNDRDGYHDDDNDRDGYHDDDNDRDGYHDDDNDRDGISDSSGKYTEIEGRITAISGTTITITVVRREYTSSIQIGDAVEINTIGARFEYTNLASLRLGDYIEAEGVYNTSTNQLDAYEVERE